MIKVINTTIFDSYNIKLASTKTKSLKLENASNTYSTFNEVKLDTDDKYEQLLLYNQFVALNCNGCTIAPVTDCANNDIYKELPRLKKFLTVSDEKIYIELRSKCYTVELGKLSRDDSDITLMVMLKNAANKKIRLGVIGYYQGQHLYTLSNKGLILTYKDFSIAKDKDILS